MIWGDRDWERDIVALVGEDPDVDQVLVFYDHPPGLDGALGESWQAVEDGILDGAPREPGRRSWSPPPSPSCSTTRPPRPLRRGRRARAVAGLRTGLACAAALQTPPPDPARLREMAAAARGSHGSPCAADRARWLAEHEAKDLLARRGPGRGGARGGGGGGRRRRARRARRPRGRQGLASRDPAQGRRRRRARSTWPRSPPSAPRSATSARAARVLVERMAPARRRADRLRAVGRGRARARDRARRRLRRGARRRRDRPAPRRPRARRARHPAAQGRRPARARRPARRRPARRRASPNCTASSSIECNPVLVHNEGAVVVDAIAKEISP